MNKPTEYGEIGKIGVPPTSFPRGEPLTTPHELEALMLRYPGINYYAYLPVPGGDLANARAKLVNALKEIDEVRKYIEYSLFERLHGSQEMVSAYRLKHLAEQRGGEYRGYICEGSAVTGALLEGLEVISARQCPWRAFIRFPKGIRRKRRERGPWRLVLSH